MNEWQEVVFLAAVIGLLALPRRRGGVRVFPRPTTPRPAPAPLPPQMRTSIQPQNWKGN